MAFDQRFLQHSQLTLLGEIDQCFLHHSQLTFLGRIYSHLLRWSSGPEGLRLGIDIHWPYDDLLRRRSVHSHEVTEFADTVRKSAGVVASLWCLVTAVQVGQYRLLGFLLVYFPETMLVSYDCPKNHGKLGLKLTNIYSFTVQVITLGVRYFYPLNYLWLIYCLF